MVAVVRAFAEDELVGPSRELEGGGHLLVGQRPAAERVVEVVPPVLQEDADLAAEREQVFCSGVVYAPRTLWPRSCG